MLNNSDEPQRIFVGIATTGRRDILSQTLTYLSQQPRHPDGVLVAIADPDDVDMDVVESMDLDVTVLTAPRGLCRQRNVIMSAAGANDIVFFLDDDFMPADNYVDVLRGIFDAAPDVVMVTGQVLADGIGGPGLDHAQGLAILRSDGTPKDEAETSARTEEVYNGYGCNMAVRMRPVHDNNLQFDDNLPNYGWLEDVDFSRRLAAHGRIVKSRDLTGVHLGTKTGRSPGRALGYSQIANPVYLVRKGTLTTRKAAYLMSRNLLANLGRMIRPEPWIDRRGRFGGNLRAAMDLVSGKLAPGRSTEI